MSVVESIAELLPFEERQEFLHMNGLPNFYYWEEGESFPIFTISTRRCAMSDYKVDRTGWKPGPWDNEPDHVEFRHVGLPCILHRVAGHGAWCGYVGVPPTHPWHGRGYDDVDVDVHGGLTYAEGCREHVCHVPQPGESDDFHWFGFDTAHAGDFMPGVINLGGLYRDVSYVADETKKLAEQLAAVEHV